MSAPTVAQYTHYGRTIAEWRDYAHAKLEHQRDRAWNYTAYYDGDFPMRQIVSDEDRQVFNRLLHEARANWCELVVNAVAERLAVVGFRYGGSDEGDDRAWYIWQANQMDADSEMAQTDALVCGHSFVSVQADDDNPAGVSIVGEHPTQATVTYAPGSRRHRIAAFKEYVDDTDGHVEAVLQLPELVVFWQRDAMTSGWSTVQPYDLQPNRLGVVSVVELTPAPRTIGAPRSELKSARPIQDRINTTIFNRLVATDYGAFRQIWATGVDLARGKDGRPVKPFDVGANRLLTNENPEGRFGAFAESTLTGYLGAVAADVQHLAAITQTPPHYLLGQMVNIPASGMKAAETGLVAKARRRASHLGEGWEDVMRLAFTAIGDERAADLQGEVIWRDFESRSEAETVDALVKMSTLGVPRSVLWQRWGASPQEVTRWEAVAADEDTTPAAPPNVTAPAVLDTVEENA